LILRQLLARKQSRDGRDERGAGSFGVRVVTGLDDVPTGNEHIADGIFVGGEDEAIQQKIILST
jgi:hypothetical protein